MQAIHKDFIKNSFFIVSPKIEMEYTSNFQSVLIFLVRFNN
jgi:hypothetical protein